MARLGRSQPNRPTIVRSTLQDPPVLTTPRPVVVTHRGIRRGVPNQANQGERNTLVDPPVLTTAPPVVVSQQRRRVPGSVVVVRNLLEQAAPPVEQAVARPVVVTSQPDRRRGVVVVARATLEDFATPAPVVVAVPTKRQLLAPPIIVRTPVEPPPLATEAIPAPLIVSRSHRPTVGPPHVLRAPIGEAVCTITRPFTGTVGRPVAGTVTRPDAGIITQPC